MNKMQEKLFNLMYANPGMEIIFLMHQNDFDEIEYNNHCRCYNPSKITQVTRGTYTKIGETVCTHKVEAEAKLFNMLRFSNSNKGAADTGPGTYEELKGDDLQYLIDKAWEKLEKKEVIFVWMEETT